MKVKKRILGGILFVVFIGAVMWFFKPYLTENRKEEETKPVEKIPKQFYELREPMDIQGMIINVSEAELIEDYDKINSFYTENGILPSPEDYVKAYIKQGYGYDFFPDDIKFLRIKYSVRNNTGEELTFNPENLYLHSIVGGDLQNWFFEAYDIRGILKDSRNQVLDLKGRKARQVDIYDRRSEEKTYAMQPGEVIEVEAVGLVNLYDIYGTEFYNTINSYHLFLMGLGSTKRVNLNIEGSFDDKGSTYLNARNIPKMKCEAWTNLEWNMWQNERMVGEYLLEQTLKPITEIEDVGQQFKEVHGISKGKNGVVESEFSVVTTLENFSIVEWKDLPLEFAERENLQKMAQRYCSLYNCKEEELKAAVLDLHYTARDTGNGFSGHHCLIDFYRRSRLYKKNEEGMFTLFGTADDWIVTENSVHPENIGSVNFENIKTDDNLSVRMAYILPPKFYQEYSELYFMGGDYDAISKMEEITIVKIKI